MLRLLRSTSVRLALGYAAVCIASSLLLVTLLWWGVASYLDGETRALIRADVQAVTDGLRRQGVPGAITTVNEHVADAADGRTVYLLADATLKPLAGNLADWPPDIKSKPDSYQIPLNLNGPPRLMQIEVVPLPDGLQLLAGRDIEDRVKIRALIFDGLGWAALGTLVIAIAGGILVRRAVLHRIQFFNRATNAIVHGDLSRRLPTHDSSDEFGKLTQTINLMLQHIETLIEGIRHTSNAIAHDLRTPLAELRAQLEEMIRVRPSQKMMLDGVHKAVDDIDRVISIFNALLRLAEIDSGVRRSGFRRVDLAELATEVAELYGPLIEENDAAFVVHACDGSSVNGDPHLLAQAIGNLVDNAVKYAPRHGVVTLRIERGDAELVDIVVSDNGPGIPDIDKPRAAERFYRCQRDDSSAGIGLGLSVVEAVARLHDGRLTLSDNHPGLSAALRIPALESARSPTPTAKTIFD
jgi:signal transduction histidine kinase